MKLPTLTVADVLLLLLTPLLLFLLYSNFWTLGSSGDKVRILLDGKPLKEVSLLQDQILEVQGHLGISRLEIKDGKVRFIASPCQGKVCIRSGWHSHGGEFAACLPNRVALQILGGNSRFDTLNF